MEKADFSVIRTSNQVSGLLSQEAASSIKYNSVTAYFEWGLELAFSDVFQWFSVYVLAS